MDTTLETTLATYVYLLHRAGIDAPSLAAALGAIDGGDESAVSTLVAGMRQGAGPEHTLNNLFGLDRLIRVEYAEDRAGRVAALRRALFGVSLPFLARIVHRDDGKLVDRWVIVESFATTVKLLDPNPWDDKEEEHELPLVDFLVRWELSGAEVTGVRG